MAEGLAKRPRLQVQSNDSKSPEWESVFNLTSFQAIRPAFAILQLGPECNADMSATFTEAKCNFKKVGVGDTGHRPLYMIDFDDVFAKGIDLLIDMKNNTRELNVEEQRAVDILENFFNKKERHEQSLCKVYKGCNSEEKNHKESCSSDTDVTVALAEHLLGKLAPGQNYVINSKVKGKREEKCVCELDHCIGKPVFQSTGIGDDKAWHGFMDLMFPSHPLAVVTAKNMYDEEKDGCESKLNSDHGAENQAIAQTIVFSLIQKSRDPSLQNFLIPNIFISRYYFRILMYDSLNDILICSVKLPIFQDNDNEGKLVIQSVVFLWIVLHYRTFCTGINVKDLLTNGSIKNINEIQSKFPDRAKEKLHLYEDSSYKIGISKFQTDSEEALPSLDSFLYGKRLFKPRRR